MISSIDIQLPELDNVIGTWRHNTDPNAAKGVPPHLTILFPWRAAPLKSSDFQELERAIQNVEQFYVTFGSVGHFENGTIFLELLENRRLEDLMLAIFKAFPDTPPYGGEFDKPTAHLTVAKAGNDPKLLRELLGEISESAESWLPITHRVVELAVMEEQADQSWRTTRTLALGCNDE